MTHRITIDLSSWEETLKNSARYRYLRDAEIWSPGVVDAITTFSETSEYGAALDAAIDQELLRQRMAKAAVSEESTA